MQNAFRVVSNQTRKFPDWFRRLTARPSCLAHELRLCTLIIYREKKYNRTLCSQYRKRTGKEEKTARRSTYPQNTRSRLTLRLSNASYRALAFRTGNKYANYEIRFIYAMRSRGPGFIDGINYCRGYSCFAFVTKLNVFNRRPVA